MTRFIWKGPHTSIELWPASVGKADAPAQPIYSGPVAPGSEIPADLPGDHDQVRGWLAFGLVEPLPAAGSAVPGEPTTNEAGLKGKGKKEHIDG